jgi:hypothetical protein
LAGVASVPLLYCELPMTSAKRCSAAALDRGASASTMQAMSQNNDSRTKFLILFPESTDA